MLRIELDSLPPAEYAANQNRGMSHWFTKKARDAALNDIGVALNQAGWDRSPPLEKVHVTVTFYLPDKRKRDHGGLVERMKPIFDALTVPTYRKDGTIHKDGYGVMLDDDLACLGWPTYRDEYRKGQSGTVIEIIPDLTITTSESP